MTSVPEFPPCRGCERPFASALVHYLHLPLDLVRSQKIICIQPLNIISVAKREGLVSGRGSSLILLRYYSDGVRFPLSRNRKRFISGAIIDDYNLLPSPCLRDRRADCVRNPFLRIESRDEN